MPSTWTQHRKCVKNALLLCGVAVLGIASSGDASAQYSGQQQSAQQQSAQQRFGTSGPSTRRFDGIIDQLSGDSASSNRNGLRADSGRSFSASGSALQRYGGDSYSDRQPALASEREPAVTLRPQPMTVRRASYEDVSAEPLRQQPLAARQEFNERNSRDHVQSFIDREKEAGVESKSAANASDAIKKIAVNLCFVLAIAVAGLLLYRVMQKGKLGGVDGKTRGQGKLKIHQVLEVSRGVNLFLVDGMNSRVLVAVDPTGIKSVNVLPGRFEEALDDPKTYSFADSLAASDLEDAVDAAEAPARPSVRISRAERRRQAEQPVVDQTSSTEIDENLIKMLLAKGSRAA